MLAATLRELGVRNVQMYDVSVTHPSYIVAECLPLRAIWSLPPPPTTPASSSTWRISCTISSHHNLQNRTVALIENGSWAPTAGRADARPCSPSCKNCTILDETVTIKIRPLKDAPASRTLDAHGAGDL